MRVFISQGVSQGCRDPPSRWHTHVVGKSMLATGRQSQGPLHKAEGPYNMAAPKETKWKSICF